MALMAINARMANTLFPDVCVPHPSGPLIFAGKFHRHTRNYHSLADVKVGLLNSHARSASGAPASTAHITEEMNDDAQSLNKSVSTSI
jgi:hypothetical protein